MNRSTEANRRVVIGCCVLVLWALMTTSLPSEAEKTPLPPKKLVKRCDQDDPVAMRLLGEFYLPYQSDPAALKKAVFWIERAATVDDHPAQIMASDFYERGFGVPKNPERAAWFAMHAARSGDVDSQARYAHFLEIGYGVPADPQAARDWYRKAADQGHAQAARWMGDDLAMIDDNAVARSESIRYLAIAARQGDAEAARKLGTMSAGLDPIEDVRPNVNIRRSPSATAAVVARTARINVMYSLGDKTDGWVEVYRPDGFVTGFVSRRALTGS